MHAAVRHGKQNSNDHNLMNEHVSCAKGATWSTDLTKIPSPTTMPRYWPNIVNTNFASRAITSAVPLAKALGSGRRFPKKSGSVIRVTKKMMASIGNATTNVKPAAHRAHNTASIAPDFCGLFVIRIFSAKLNNREAGRLPK